MQTHFPISRRTFLRLGGTTLAVATVGALANCGPAAMHPTQRAVAPLAVPMAAPPTPDPAFVPDVELTLTATTGVVTLLDGKPTNVWQVTFAM